MWNNFRHLFPPSIASDKKAVHRNTLPEKFITKIYSQSSLNPLCSLVNIYTDRIGSKWSDQKKIGTSLFGGVKADHFSFLQKMLCDKFQNILSCQSNSISCLVETFFILSNPNFHRGGTLNSWIGEFGFWCHEQVISDIKKQNHEFKKLQMSFKVFKMKKQGLNIF